MKKLLLALVLTMSLLILPVHAAEVPVELTAEAPVLDLTYSPSIAVHIASDGTITSTDIVITNNSSVYPAKLTSTVFTPAVGWTFNDAADPSILDQNVIAAIGLFEVGVELPVLMTQSDGSFVFDTDVKDLIVNPNSYGDFETTFIMGARSAELSSTVIGSIDMTVEISPVEGNWIDSPATPSGV